MEMKIKGVANIRDFGGYETADGRKIKSRSIIRSGSLAKIKKSGIKKLVYDYNLKTIIDLRTDTEVKDKPFPDMAGVTYLHHSVVSEESIGVTRDSASMHALVDKVMKDNISGDEFMRKIYSDIVNDKTAMAHYREFLEKVLACDGAVLFNCSQGKDRTGLGAVLILSVLGVPEQTILEDYYLTEKNMKSRKKLIRLALKLKKADPFLIDFMDGVMSAKKDYIEPVFAEIKEKYGSMENFIREAVGFSDENVKKFREKYLTIKA